MTLDELEKAFLKDAIPEHEYTEICERSLRQYKALLADETIAYAFQGLEEFKAKWDVYTTLLSEKKNKIHLHSNSLRKALAPSPPCNRTSSSRHAVHHRHGLVVRPRYAGLLR